MSGYSRRIAAGIVIVVLITAFVAVELDDLYSPASSSSSSSQSSMSTEHSASSTNSTNGLQLKMTLNSSTIPSHGAVFARIELVNTLNRNVSVGPVPEFNQTIGALHLDMQDLNNYDFTCSQNPTQFLVDFALLRGHYSAANVSSAGTPLSLRAAINPPCPGFYIGQSEVTFLPDGDQAVTTALPSNSSGSITASLNATTFYCTGSGLGGNGGEVNCGNGQGLVGYWNDTADPQGVFNFSSPAFTYFPPGEYTIVACDAWNQYVYATFTVT
jgi:hypothetical protein